MFTNLNVPMFSFVFNDLQKSIIDPAKISFSKVYSAELKKNGAKMYKTAGKCIIEAIIYLYSRRGQTTHPKGLLRLNLRIFYISFHFSTKLAR